MSELSRVERHPIRDCVESTRFGTLGAILLNPALKPEDQTTSYTNLTVASAILGCSAVTIANLFSVPTRDLPSINAVGGDLQAWSASRGPIAELVDNADHVVLGWGLGGLSGDAHKHCNDQVAWVLDRLRTRPSVWMVGGRPRHPSRWLQFTGVGRGIAVGSTFEDRLRSVLEESPTGDALCAGL